MKRTSFPEEPATTDAILHPAAPTRPYVEIDDRLEPEAGGRLIDASAMRSRPMARSVPSTAAVDQIRMFQLGHLMLSDQRVSHTIRLRGPDHDSGITLNATSCSSGRIGRRRRMAPIIAATHPPATANAA
jgi:hypothetical protein